MSKQTIVQRYDFKDDFNPIPDTYGKFVYHYEYEELLKKFNTLTATVQTLVGSCRNIIDPTKTLASYVDDSRALSEALAAVEKEIGDI